MDILYKLTAIYMAVIERRVININSTLSDVTHQLSGDILRKELIQTNVILGLDNIDQTDFLVNPDSSINRCLQSYRRLGFVPISESYFLHAYSYIIEKYGLTIPFDGEYKRSDELKDNPVLRSQVIKARASFVKDIQHRLKFVKGEDDVRIIVVEDGVETDATEQVKKLATEHLMLVDQLRGYDAIEGKMTRELKEFTKTNKGLVILSTNKRIDNNAPIISTGNSVLAKTADTVVAEEKLDGYQSIKSLIAERVLDVQRRMLAQAVTEGRIQIVEAFNRENWLHHPLISHLKRQIEAPLRNAITKSGVVCDFMDAQYQTLFRLTTYEVTELFSGGDSLVKFGETLNSDNDWHSIKVFDGDEINHLEVNLDILGRTIDEQLRVIGNRLRESQLPIAQIVNQDGIFAEEGWELKKVEGRVYAIKKDNKNRVLDQRNILFTEVSPDLANQFHRDLHYIHTQRCQLGFGFKLEGDDLPFSVLAIDQIDRSYKQNTLLLFGYDPRNCIDFTRLYSRPGSPKNTSSAMFGEAFKQLRLRFPKLEAALSAFMPSYATGLSMSTGGFEIPILAKPNVHYFSPTVIDGMLVREHVTHRRMKDLDVDLLESKLPLLPTIELIAPLAPPRFEPVLKLGKDMVII